MQFMVASINKKTLGTEVTNVTNVKYVIKRGSEILQGVFFLNGVHIVALFLGIDKG